MTAPAPPAILTPDQRPRVFISSTLAELAADRAAARAAVESLRLIPVMFELGARPHPARALYRAYLAQSHVFVGIYAQQYGWVAPGEDVSGLEDEYALSASLPRLVYLKTVDSREPRLEALLDRIRDDDTVAYKAFADADELRRLLRDDLAVLLGERFLLGGGEPPAVDDVPGAGASPSLLPAALPHPMTDLLGRADEVAEVERLLASGERLVTLVGPGGIGKTRIAVETARRVLGRGEAPVAFVPLENVDDPAAVLAAVATALGVGLDGGVAALDALVAALGERSLLLLLDNVEQVAGAASDVAALLVRCPGVAVLATGRSPWRLRGESQVPVGPLGLPEGPDDALVGAGAGTLSDAPAVQLFVERARSVQPAFDLADADDAAAVAALVRRLDGIPLAIEMAAARTRLLTPRALLDRVGSALDLGSRASDLPARQRTVRDTLAWSEQLLPAEQRALLARLSLFVAPWTLADAEAVAGPGVGDVLDAVAGLVDGSLAIPAAHVSAEPRFRLYETVRAFAGERLAGADRTDAEGRLVTHLAALAELTDRGIRSPDHARWRAALRLTWPDLRRGWELALHQEDAAAAAQFTATWVGLWLDGRLVEARDLMARTLDLADQRHPPRHGDCLLSVAGYAFNQGDDDRTRALLARLGTDVPLPEAPEGVGAVSLYLGYLTAAAGDLDGAEAHLGRSVLQLAGLGPQARWIEAFAHSGLGSLHAFRGDVDGAIAEHGLSRDLGRECGNRAAEMQASVFLALLRLVEGDAAEAGRLLGAAADLVEEQPFYEGNAYCVEAAAALGLAAGDPSTAAHALGVAAALRDVVGARVWPLLQPATEQVRTAVGAALDPAAFEVAFAAGRAADPRTAAALVRAVVSTPLPSDHGSERL